MIKFKSVIRSHFLQFHTRIKLLHLYITFIIPIPTHLNLLSVNQYPLTRLGIILLADHNWLPCIFDLLPTRTGAQGVLDGGARWARPSIAQLPVKQSHRFTFGELQFAPVLESVIVAQPLAHLDQCEEFFYLSQTITTLILFVF